MKFKKNLIINIIFLAFNLGVVWIVDNPSHLYSFAAGFHFTVLIFLIFPPNLRKDLEKETFVRNVKSEPGKAVIGSV